jgi:hypothetical protein
MYEHFFQSAPVISWLTWILRRIWSSEIQEPSPIPTELYQQPIPSPTRIQPISLRQDRVQEYSVFLQQFFYSSEKTVQLVLPPTVLQAGIQSKLFQGCEVRDAGGALAGIVGCMYAGNFKGQPVGVITWLCVHPSWRNKGMTNALLRGIYKLAQPYKIYIWRNDGILSSPAPPLWSEGRIVRKKQNQRVTSRLDKPQIQLQRVPLAKWRNHITAEWSRRNPAGLVLDDPAFPTRLVEVYEYTVKPGAICILCVQPTFERQKQTGEPWCEVITWVFQGVPENEYIQSQYIETMLDALPYGWFEASALMPHLQEGWLNAGQSSWSLFGLDPGVPVQRPVLSLCAN